MARTHDTLILVLALGACAAAVTIGFVYRDTLTRVQECRQVGGVYRVDKGGCKMPVQPDLS